jgi:hypothetical protein
MRYVLLTTLLNNRSAKHLYRMTHFVLFGMMANGSTGRRHLHYHYDFTLFSFLNQPMSISHPAQDRSMFWVH